MTNDVNILTIKESLQSIVKQLDPPKARPTNEIKALASKIYNLLLQNNISAERFYFIYLTCQLCIDAKPAKVEKIMKVILPTPTNAQSSALISDLISFALCHPSVYTSILDNMSSYLNASDLIYVDMECWYQAKSLAVDSPSFCSALISRTDLPHLGIDKKLLAEWLQDLSKSEEEFPPPSLNQLIKYSLFHRAPQNLTEEEQHASELASSDFHFGILTLIQTKKCQTLTNQFLIDVISTLAQQIESQDQNSDSQSTILIDRFAQIISVAAASKVTTITNALRNSLSKLDTNQLIATLIQWPSK